MDIKEVYQQWLDAVDEEEKQELLAIENNEKELEDRFYCNLSFGTAGMRGVLGLGTNRMNRYMVRKASVGLARWIKSKGLEEKGIAIAGDTRHGSREFSMEVACTMATFGIRTYLYNGPSATPLLSYTVRNLNCGAGVVVTASHNTKEYNGYKVYDGYGCQMVSEDASEVAQKVDEASPFERILPESEAMATGLIQILGRDEEIAFCHETMKQGHEVPEEAKKQVKIVYTPLHGTGLFPVPYTLNQMGYTLNIVEEQTVCDGEFATVKKPNPEEPEAMTMGIRLGEEIGADIVLATDPDCDRVGIAIPMADGSFQLLNGNQIGALIVNYLTLRRKESVNDKSLLIKSIVTDDFGASIAKKNGIAVREVLTGFKYIGEVMTEIEQAGSHEYFFGYEESNGFLVGTHGRDKDGVVTSLILCEMTAWYKQQGYALHEIMRSLHHRFGYYLNAVDNLVFPGSEGKKKMAGIMDSLRHKGNLFNEAVEIRDYLNGYEELPPSNVLKYSFADGCFAAVRPSGTEPKLKIYYCIRAKSRPMAQARLVEISDILQEECQ